MAYILPGIFFLMALLVNSIRWIYMILYHKKIALTSKSKIPSMIFLLMSITVMFANAGFQIRNQCVKNRQELMQDFEILIFTTGIINLILLIIFVLASYTYSCIFFRNHYKEQLIQYKSLYSSRERKQITKDLKYITRFFIALIIAFLNK